MDQYRAFESTEDYKNTQITIAESLASEHAALLTGHNSKHDEDEPRHTSHYSLFWNAQSTGAISRLGSVSIGEYLAWTQIQKRPLSSAPTWYGLPYTIRSVAFIVDSTKAVAAALYAGRANFSVQLNLAAAGSILSLCRLFSTNTLRKAAIMYMTLGASTPIKYRFLLKVRYEPDTDTPDEASGRFSMASLCFLFLSLSPRDRMLSSALNFAIRFFGCPLEGRYQQSIIIEADGYDNTLAPYKTPLPIGYLKLCELFTESLSSSCRQFGFVLLQELPLPQLRSTTLRPTQLLTTAPLHSRLVKVLTWMQHEAVALNILTALNLTNFTTSGPLPADHIPPNRSSRFILSLFHIEYPLPIVVSDGVIPLTSIKSCPTQKDDLCPVSTFVAAMKEMIRDTDGTYWFHAQIPLGAPNWALSCSSCPSHRRRLRTYGSGSDMGGNSLR
ncbi:hypothetical protein NM688_g600 [Phlebia brevispora]|uniref:Uncharacterized protein n=1 Tax=Phlebia brevispora TaxID=194682 RepID=A0ACC1TE99_9APHY|nr:hypothetical protein NM688_g600 [Phlebia brevispora]